MELCNGILGTSGAITPARVIVGGHQDHINKPKAFVGPDIISQGRLRPDLLNFATPNGVRVGNNH